MRAWKCAAALAVFATAAVSAQAEWTTQRIALQPGWNAVFLEVEPEANDCETVFGGLPVESVWAWNERFTAAQYVRNPSELLPENPEWLTWFPEGSEHHIITDLFAVFGGKAYLVKLGGSQSAELVVSGMPVVPEKKWMPNSYNLAGFHIDPNNRPTFASFFAPEKALDGQPIYRMDSQGRWQRVTSPSTERLDAGAAYWIYCGGQSVYSGPLSLELNSNDVLDFGESLTEQVLGFRNATDDARTITVRLLPTAAAGKSLAGNVALSYQQILSWQPLDEPLTINLEPRDAAGLRLAVRRADMPSAETETGSYGGILEISDDQGGLYHVAVSANKTTTPAGLWVGTATLNMVSEAGNPQDSTTPTAAPAEFSFRLILHVDADGKASLLQEVFLMQVRDDPPPATGKGINFEDFIEDEPARYVLITDETLLDDYEGVVLRDGEIVGRRISSPVFAFDGPQEMTGTVTTQLRLRNPIVIDYDDPLNPFVHRFHPDHDNLDERYENMLPEGDESFTVSRNVMLQFSAQDPEQLGLPNWGYDIIGGTYKETITGLHKRAIHVQGRFKLNKVSHVDVLNDGQ